MILHKTGGSVNKKNPAWSMVVAVPMVRETNTRSVTHPKDAAEMVPELASFAQEAFCVLDLNTRSRVIDKRLVSLGVLDSSLVHPREVFRGAISNGAHRVILLHNHPSGDITPSVEDLRVTRQLVEAGKIVGIDVVDHIIVGVSEDVVVIKSMREAGLVSF